VNDALCLKQAAFLLCIKPDGQRGVVEVTTVDQADMRALGSLKTVVRHGAASL
jgi:hypothetical protein